jgi:hypothetical protein
MVEDGKLKFRWFCFKILDDPIHIPHARPHIRTYIL